MEHSNVNKAMVGGLYLAWGIPVADFTINPSYSPTTWPVWLAMSVSILFTMVDRRFMALTIPFVAMLSPMGSAARVMGLLPSEIFIAYCALFSVAVLLAGNGRIRLLPGDGYLIALVCIAILSYLLSFEYRALLPTILNWGALITTFAVTRMSLRTTRLMGVYFLSLVVVAAYTSALTVSGFVNGMQLALFMDGSETVLLDRESLGYLFRASYFYTNGFFVIGVAVIISFRAMFTAKEFLQKIVLGGLVVGMMSTLLLMFAKTALVALAFCLLIGILLSFFARKPVQERTRVTQVLFIGFVCAFLWFTVSRIVETTGYYQFDISSLTARLNVMSSAINVLLQHPERLVFGFGPDASIRVSDAATDAARWSGSTTEGAIDSAYMTFLFEYGLIFLVLFLGFGVHTTSRLLQFIKRDPQRPRIVMTLFLVIGFIYIAAATQVIGTSKVAWVLVQIFALSGICLSRSAQTYRALPIESAIGGNR